MFIETGTRNSGKEYINQMGTFFCGDVVLVSFNMAYRDENSILDQMYEEPFFFDFYYEDLKF